MPSVNDKNGNKKTSSQKSGTKKTSQPKTTRGAANARKTPTTKKKVAPNNSPKIEKETIAQSAEPKKITGPKENRSYFTKGQSFLGYLLTILTSVVVAVMLTLLLIPLALRLNPIEFYRGNFFKNKTSKTIISTKSPNNIVAAVAKKVKPSVVTISAISQSSSDFFRGAGQEEKATGTGIIFRSDGYILTNNHVIENANRVFVTFGKSTDVPGKVISGDSESDIAVIKIDKNNLPVADIGSTKNLEVGDLAVAVGSPFRFYLTVTAGIISAKNRAFGITDYKGSSSNTLTDLLQTDAAINPGNSGGALANAKGEIIGINTAIASSSRSSAGIGFAIPIEKAMSVAKQLITKQKVSHPYIGVSIIETEKVSLPNLPKGVFVRQVMPGSPAQKAGLKDGDVITKANGTRVKTAEDLIVIIKRGKVGKNLRATFLRDGKTKTVAITLAEKPSRLQP